MTRISARAVVVECPEFTRKTQKCFKKTFRVDKRLLTKMAKQVDFAIQEHKHQIVGAL